VTGILVIDTASPAGIALAYLARAGAEPRSVSSDGPHDHSRHLVAAIDALTGGTRQLRAIGVVTGPGSFAGLRVGIAAAESLGLGLGVPVYGVTTFEAVLEALGTDSATLVHPAGRGEFVLQRFASGRARGPARAVDAAELAQEEVAGEGAAAFGGREVTREERAIAALRIVERRVAAGERPAGIEAHYLREPNVSRPRRTPLVAGPRTGDT
jgi:tRNA threonylcarbamoyl adenosine modification protein YeaZ